MCCLPGRGHASACRFTRVGSQFSSRSSHRNMYVLHARHRLVRLLLPACVRLQVQARRPQGACQAGVQDESPGVRWACAPSVGAAAAAAHGSNRLPVGAAGKQVKMCDLVMRVQILPFPPRTAVVMRTQPHPEMHVVVVHQLHIWRCPATVQGDVGRFPCGLYPNQRLVAYPNQKSGRTSFRLHRSSCLCLPATCLPAWLHCRCAATGMRVYRVWRDDSYLREMLTLLQELQVC